ncbi:hypothetical protein A2108_00570 [Candidatus Wolfebacteria bacterium GWA1_42_9]|uniref:AI-2E family transporter n=1 Tax=Candidatus Wolfebacteria bacterium GWA1_42_9 TaxID=1802553 RepID=A0A1F8DLS5_9BACT|nr:MAG: hypothetical protein UW08_C0001G0058 [Parcubacteria group bacterium GW2011_GWB1_43_8b]OGM89554.1 MAG: hypothetical protein A2108_00570 [Candidatus Wolfebacteria bacterium GWA1_42_9]
MEKRIFDVSWKTLWRIFVMVVFALALFAAREVLVILLLAIIISSALYEPVAYLERKKIPRLLSILTIFLVGAGILGLVLYALVPIASIQLKYLLTNIDSLKLPLLDFLGSSEAVAQLDQAISNFLSGIFSGGEGLNWFSSLMGNIIFASIVLILSFYLTLSRDGVERFIRAVFPANQEDYAVDLFIRTRKKLSRWLSGQLIISFIVGSLVFVGLLAVGLDYALVLAILAAVLELIPYVGPITVGIIAFLVTLPQSLTTAFLVVLIFFVIQQIENHVLSPFVMSRAIGIDPVAIVIAMLAGTQIAGFVGIILAVPVTIILQEVVEDWAARKKKPTAND